jgi:hypothetical protein
VGKLGLLARTMRSFGTPRLGEFCLDCALDQDWQEAADPGVDEALRRAVEVVAHVGFVVVPIVGVLGHQPVFELGELCVDRVIGFGMVGACSGGEGHDVVPVRGLSWAHRLVDMTTCTTKVGLEDECNVNDLGAAMPHRSETVNPLMSGARCILTGAYWA